MYKYTRFTVLVKIVLREVSDFLVLCANHKLHAHNV